MEIPSRNRIPMGIGLALGCILFTSGSLCHAQDPTQGQQQGQLGGGGGFGGGGRRGGGQGGPGGGFGSRFAMGKVTGGDSAAGTVTLATQQGTTLTVKVTTDTTIDTQQTIAISDLKVGDQVQVQGIPSAITANQITAGTPPAFMGGRGGGRRQPGANGAQPGGQQVDANGNPIQAPSLPPPITTTRGRVISTKPSLVINVSEDVDIVLKLGRDAKITRYVRVPFNNIKAGDTIIATGATADDGTFLATGLGLNMQIGGPGAPGGFGFGGGPGGGFGPGGGGGFGGGGGRRGGGGGGFGGGGVGGGQQGGNPAGSP